MGLTLTGLTLAAALPGRGEVLVRLTGLPIPGAVVGMVILFGPLQGRRPREDSGVLRVAAVLRHLQLLLVPAGVGVVVDFATPAC